MVRSVANVLGGLFSKYLLHRLQVASLTIIYLLIVVVSLIASTLSLSTFNLSITLFFSSISLVGIAVIIYGVTIKLFLEEKPDYWVQLLGFTFAIGAMCGPLFVYLF
jgi:NhaP-type Na+/H+ or K+/H+ antiporter